MINNMNIKHFSTLPIKAIIKETLGITLMTLGIIISLGIGVCLTTYGIMHLTEKNYSYTIFKSKAELSYYATKDDLVKCIDEYIHSIAEDSAMNGFALLENCDKYNVDVRFVIAQAQIEAHFATKGVAAKTHSAFNVLAYDGRSAEDMIKKGHAYKHPDESIEPYLKLLTTDYMVNGKTEMDLLDKFVNKAGKRYASSQTYEQALRSAYQTLITETNITALYSEYQKYKMICGK